MPGWILILVLVDPAGYAAQIESVATPFASHEACNTAGVEARAWLPILTKPGSSTWSRIDWVCVETGETRPAREVCEEREAARQKMRAQFRAISRKVVDETDRVLAPAPATPEVKP
jgi:hypothetical protein